jgi:hypothetical protein
LLGSAANSARAAPSTSPVKFRRLVQHGTAERPTFNVELDYAFPSIADLTLSNVGPVPSSGSISFVTDKPKLAFADAATENAVAEFDLPAEVQALRSELSALGSSAAQRLRHDEILLTLGEASDAIPDLSLLASAATVPASTREFASLQLGQAFASTGDVDAALAQYYRVAAHGSRSARQEALVRTSDLELSRGRSVQAGYSLSRLSQDDTGEAPGAYANHAKSTQKFLSVWNAAASGPSRSRAVTSMIGTPSLDRVPVGAFTVLASRHWKNTKNFSGLIGRLWRSLFTSDPKDFPCPPDRYCAATGFYNFPAQISGLCGRWAFRISHWYPNKSAGDGYRVEIAAQANDCEAGSAYKPVTDETMNSALGTMADEFVREVGFLEDAQ